MPIGNFQNIKHEFKSRYAFYIYSIKQFQRQNNTDGIGEQTCRRVEVLPENWVPLGHDDLDGIHGKHEMRRFLFGHRTCYLVNKFRFGDRVNTGAQYFNAVPRVNADSVCCRSWCLMENPINGFAPC